MYYFSRYNLFFVKCWKMNKTFNCVIMELWWYETWSFFRYVSGSRVDRSKRMNPATLSDQNLLVGISKVWDNRTHFFDWIRMWFKGGGNLICCICEFLKSSSKILVWNNILLILPSIKSFRIDIMDIILFVEYFF